MSVFLSGKRRKCDVSNHSRSVRSSRDNEAFFPSKKKLLSENVTGTPDCKTYCPVNCHPPTNASAHFGMREKSALPRPIGNSQMGAIEVMNVRSAGLITWFARCAISGPRNEFSSIHFDHVNAPL